MTEQSGKQNSPEKDFDDEICGTPVKRFLFLFPGQRTRIHNSPAFVLLNRHISSSRWIPLALVDRRFSRFLFRIHSCGRMRDRTVWVALLFLFNDVEKRSKIERRVHILIGTVVVPTNQRTNSCCRLCLFLIRFSLEDNRVRSISNVILTHRLHRSMTNRRKASFPS